MTMTLPTTGDRTPAGAFPPAVPGLLAFVAGYVDVTTFLAFSGLFVAQATGSLVVAGAAIDTGGAAFVKVAAIPVFFLAGIATTLIVRHFHTDRAGALAVTLLAESLLIGGIIIASLVAPADGNVAPLFGLAAMGVQSATARLLLADYGSTNVMTSNITQFSIDVEDTLAGLIRGTPMRSALTGVERIGLVLLSFLAGVVIGAFGFRVTGMLGLAVMMATLMGIAAWAMSAANGLNRVDEGGQNG